MEALFNVISSISVADEDLGSCESVVGKIEEICGVAMPERLNESLEARVAAQNSLFGSKAFAKQKGTYD